jgi:methylmalonyl-CoA mutase
LTAVPVCDGHDSAINTINLEFIRHGIEVIYLGYHRSARDMVRAAVQEDARAVGISSYNGGHVEFFDEVVRRLRKEGASDIRVFGGGGGTITPAEARAMQRRGVDRIFFAGTPLEAMVKFVKERYGRVRRLAAPKSRRGERLGDRELGRLLTAVEMANGPGLSATRDSSLVTSHPSPATRTLGITGPGGAGKTTLIDELALRFLKARPRARLAILSHDPSLVGRGALLGDRATMIHSQDDRVFMRSLATRGQAGGLSSATERCLRRLRSCGFDLILIETVGVGQEAMPFGRELADKTVFVMSPDYGSRLQLQKIVMLDVADVVVINKADLPGARTAGAEVEQRLQLNRREQKLVATVAKRHGDPGVDELFRLLEL